jgi:hypothetical protein
MGDVNTQSLKDQYNEEMDRKCTAGMHADAVHTRRRWFDCVFGLFLLLPFGMEWDILVNRVAPDRRPCRKRSKETMWGGEVRSVRYGLRSCTPARNKAGFGPGPTTVLSSVPKPDAIRRYLSAAVGAVARDRESKHSRKPGLCWQGRVPIPCWRVNGEEDWGGTASRTGRPKASGSS